MESAKQQTVLLGVTGSIAAYKACELVRLYQRSGFKVKVIMTQRAQELVGAATFRGLTRQPVALDLFDDPRNPINHISLAQEADALVIAPCTANVLNKIANGVADDLLTTTALANEAPLLLAPAMNVAMLKNSITQKSLKALASAGVTIVGPESGYLACGTEDSGRMSSPEDICLATVGMLLRAKSLSGKRILITAGPTREHLDPVRYLSSPSSGKTGFALAQEAVARGADVVLISGPTHLTCPLGVEYVPVTSAEEMLQKASKHFDGVDIAIFSAAVSDFRPAEQHKHKLKKRTTPAPIQENQNSLSFFKSQEQDRIERKQPSLSEIKLVENPDILATLAARRREFQSGKPYIVGFAAETENVLANAQAKLISKDADLIIANDVSDPLIGFASESNRAIFVESLGHESTELMSKQMLAGVILDRIATTLSIKNLT
ncbi:MAG: bifunctional phosphopantothenoylcysteine decarboxylase/phosphopantothenate--cysteine ligase CoaBC [Coriobacteriia bacterium]|nr:bifunctional phosphopantothenoylcysteine decarboxylase/phosphopantothenate--cysteine ligase CoaBC [Coriobacteriia bacterium]